MLPRYAPRAKRELELEASVRVVQARAEQLAQPCQPVTDRLRMHVERLRDRLGPAAMAQPRVQRGPKPLAGELGLQLERRQRRLRDVPGQPPIRAQQQRQPVAL